MNLVQSSLKPRGLKWKKKSAQDFTAKFNCLNDTAVLRKAQNTRHKQLPAAQRELMSKTLCLPSSL